jgi:propionyl-CoA carboxylase alpha chain
MIRVAAGEKLGFGQEDVKLQGWSIENRVYAEDPYRGFLPSTGRLVRYRPPQADLHQAPFASGDAQTGVSTSLDTNGVGSNRPQPFASSGVGGTHQTPFASSEVEKRVSTSLDTNGGRRSGGVRVDDGVFEGGEVSMFYDPMIAKLVTWGGSREEAIDRQVAALDSFVIDGIGHNVDFLSALMQHPRFRAGELTTGFIAEEYPEGFHGAPAQERLTCRLAALAGVLSTQAAERALQVEGQLGTPLQAPAEWMVRIGPLDYPVSVAGDNVSTGEDDMAVDVEFLPGQRLVEAHIDGETLFVGVERTTAGWKLTTRGARYDVRVLTPRTAELARHMIEKVPPDLSRFLLCPMPGLLTALHVAEGDKVEAGQPLAVVEAMKMENILRAEKSGTVAKVAAKPGDSLAVDAVILEFE